MYFQPGELPRPASDHAMTMQCGQGGGGRYPGNGVGVHGADHGVPP